MAPHSIQKSQGLKPSEAKTIPISVGAVHARENRNSGQSTLSFRTLRRSPLAPMFFRRLLLFFQPRDLRDQTFLYSSQEELAVQTRVVVANDNIQR